MHILYQRIKEQIQAVGRHDFAKLAGYCNVAKCLRQLDNFLATGDAPDFFLFRLCHAVGLTPEECAPAVVRHRQALLEKQRREEEDYERRIFKPHVLVRTDGSSQAPVFIKIFTQHSLRINISERNRNEEAVANIVRDHFAQNHGRLCYFVKILHYVYRPTFEQSIVFGVDGTVLERLDRPVSSPSGYFMLKNRRRIPNSIFSPKLELTQVES